MINKIDFKAKNLTSNAGLFLLLENAKSNGIFDFIENDLVFDNDSTNKIKMNHIKTIKKVRQKDIILRNWETDATISNLHFATN